MNHSLPDALGQSDTFLRVQERISQVAPINRPVLIIGERGTGKELAATRLHYLSKRWQHPFITLNCAALNPSVLESELFGHEAGAFTGAVKLRKGRFEMAQEGTLFLDEIGNMPICVQEKILRVIEYGSFERVGGSTPVAVDVRIIAATNANLPLLVNKGVFKADLLDRLSFEVITLPPLRNRREDILLLARHFATQMASELDLAEPPRFSDAVCLLLIEYSWPGNIRELKNAVERAVYQNAGTAIKTITINPFEEPAPHPMESINAKDSNRASPSNTLPPDTPTTFPSRSDTVQVPTPCPLPRLLEALEQQYLQCALKTSRYNQKKAAQLLGITYHQLRSLYRKHQSRGNEPKKM